MDKEDLIAKRDELEQLYKNGIISKKELSIKVGEINVAIMKLESTQKIREQIERDKLESEKMKSLIVNVIILFLIFYVVPSIIILIYNFLSLVVFGHLNVSQFDWQYYSFERVYNFYLQIYERSQSLLYRLEH